MANTKTLVDIALNHVEKHAGEAAEYKIRFHEMCRYYMSLLEGDDLHVETAYNLMRMYGVIDENDELIEDE